MIKIRTLWIFTGVLLFVNIVVYLFHLGGDKLMPVFSNTFPVICSLVSSVCLFKAYRGFRKFDFTKLAWLMIFIGITFNFSAELLYAVFEIVLKMDMNANFPSMADYLWCIGYFPLFAGLVIMLWGYFNSGLPMGSSKLYLVMVVILLVFFPVVSWYLFLPILHDTQTDSLSKFFYLFYPIADSIVVVPAVILMFITKQFGSGSISLPWRYLSVGLVLFTLADLIFSYLSWQDLYGSGNFIDLAWHTGYLLIGLSALYQYRLVKSFEGNSK